MADPNSSSTTGLCECGCGGLTSVALYTRRSRGYVLGQHLRFCAGHHKRTPGGSKYKYVGKDRRLHRVRAEMALGKALPSRAQVHHADGSRSDDAPLVICQDAGYHKLLHARMRVKAAGGNPNTDAVCGRCGRAKNRSCFAPEARAVFGVRSACVGCVRSRPSGNN